MNIIFKPECKTEIIEPTYDLPIIGEPISKTGASANNSNAYGVIVGIIGDGSSRRVRVMTEGYIDYDKVKENYMEYTAEAINALTGITLCSGGKLPTGVQPDWNQNDNTKPDYVKNRPFYTGGTVETVLLQEQTVTFTDGWSDTSFDFDISSEGIVKVIWDGTEYICIPEIFPNLVGFGNRFLDNESFENTGEPFWYDGESFYTNSSANSHQIKVSKISNEVIQIDLKYIPNGNIRNGLSRFSTEEGSATTASGVGSHAEGSESTASGNSSHAEGFLTIASGDYSHAEGSQSTASGVGSHAEGTSTASGKYSHAEGTSTKASGVGSHTEGGDTKASGKYAHAEGFLTIASGEYSHAEGKYNIEDTTNKYAHIIGNGTSISNRHNCFMVGWDGAIYVQASDNTAIMMKLTIKSDGTILAEQVTV